MVQGIEPGGRIYQDGRLKEHDRIIEINNIDLHNITFPKFVPFLFLFSHHILLNLLKTLCFIH
jgi:partitioning defective protein 3